MTNLNDLIKIDLFEKVKPINLSVKINTLLSLFKGNEEVLVCLEKEFTDFVKNTTLKADIKKNIESILHRNFYEIWMKRPIKIEDMVLINTYFPQYVATQQHHLNTHIENSIGSQYKLEAKIITDVVLAIGQYRKNKPEDLMKIASSKIEITEKDSHKYISLIRKHYIKGTLPVVTYLLEKYPENVNSLHIPNEILLEESSQTYQSFMNATEKALKLKILSEKSRNKIITDMDDKVNINILSNQLTTTLINVDIKDREDFKIDIFKLCSRITRYSKTQVGDLYNSLINIELVFEKVRKDIYPFIEYEFGIKETGIEAIIKILKKCKDPIESISESMRDSLHSIKDIDEKINNMIDTISRVYLYKKLDKSIVNDKEEKKLKL